MEADDVLGVISVRDIIRVWSDQRLASRASA
jgi:hypothetical protein